MMLLTVIKPVPELIEAIFNKVFCSSEIEPWIDYNGVLRSVAVDFNAVRLN